MPPAAHVQVESSAPALKQWLGPPSSTPSVFPPFVEITEEMKRRDARWGPPAGSMPWSRVEVGVTSADEDSLSGADAARVAFRNQDWVRHCLRKSRSLPSTTDKVVVRVTALILPDGSVGEARALEPHPEDEIARCAVAAVGHHRFTPPRSGAPVELVLNWTLMR